MKRLICLVYILCFSFGCSRKTTESWEGCQYLCEKFGVDYSVLLENAKLGNKESVMLFLWLSVNAGLDGAYAEEYSSDLSSVVMEALGDATFADYVRSSSKEIQKEILSQIEFDLENPNDPDWEIKMLQKWPLTMKILRK